MKSIYSKIITGFLFSIIVSFMLSAFFVFKRNNEKIISLTADDINKVHYLVSNEIEEKGIDQEEMNSLAHSLDMNILIYSGDSVQYSVQALEEESFPDEKTIVQFMNSENMNYVKNYNSFMTLGFKCTAKGENYCVFLQKDISSETDIFQSSIFLAGGLTFIVGSIFFLIFADIIVKPLSRLSDATAELAKGNYSVHVDYKGKDEIGRLSKNFNFLANQLTKTEKTRQRFISEISHEFQTPLTSIQGFAAILKDESLTSEQREKFSDIIVFESKRLSTLSKNMLQLTLLEGEDVKLNIENYDLNAQLSRVVESLKENAENKNIEIKMNIPKREAYIDGDQNRLEQVWINLLNNAIKYTEENGYISVNMKKNVSNCEVSINDTGIGMSEEAQRHIFERFYREDKARSIGGNGLGLAIVKSIVDLHNGSIEVKSQKDVGSEFHVILPLKQKIKEKPSDRN